MKRHNRMRANLPSTEAPRQRAVWPFPEEQAPAELEALAPPKPIRKITPEEVVEDILLATLSRIQRSANAEIVAAAERYINLLRNGQLQA